MTHPKTDLARLRHMLAESQKTVARLLSTTRTEFGADEDLAAATAWRLSVIGEAASQLSQLTHDRNPAIPWRHIDLPDPILQLEAAVEGDSTARSGVE